MRVELPEGYVPPQPTHPMYGYLTPEEQEAFEAEEQTRLGIVPGVPEVSEVTGGSEGSEVEGVTGASWAPPRLPAPAVLPALEEETEQEELGEIDEALEAAEATVGRTGGWVPAPPPEPVVEPVVEPAALGAVGEFRWDAYKQEWVPAGPIAPAVPVVTEEPPPDVAAAAGGRGASSSWTSGDGSRFRWDARAQRWITEPPESG
jgi:hypothetical protein